MPSLMITDRCCLDDAFLVTSSGNGYEARIGYVSRLRQDDYRNR